MFLRNPIFLLFFRGGGGSGPPVPPSGSAHAQADIPRGWNSYFWLVPCAVSTNVSCWLLNILTLIPPLLFVLKMLSAFYISCILYSSALQTRFFHGIYAIYEHTQMRGADNSCDWQANRMSIKFNYDARQILLLTKFPFSTWAGKFRTKNQIKKYIKAKLKKLQIENES